MSVKVEKFMGVFSWLVFKTPGSYNVVGKRLVKASQITSQQVALVVRLRTLDLVLELLQIFFQEDDVKVEFSKLS